MLLGHWLDQQEIPDPYRHSDEMFKHVYVMMDKATKSWQANLV